MVAVLSTDTRRIGLIMFISVFLRMPGQICSGLAVPVVVVGADAESFASIHRGGSMRFWVQMGGKVTGFRGGVR